MDKVYVEEHAVSRESQYQIRVLSDRDRTELKQLLKDTFRMNDDFLTWKYDANPNFDQSLVVVAVNSGQVAGCMNWLPRTLKISTSFSARAALGSDLAVHRDHRGKSLAKPLIASENMILENKGIVMSYGFIDAELVAHVHGPLLGLVEVRTSTTVYKKYFNVSKIEEKVAKMNEIARSDEGTGRRLAGLDMRVLFCLRGMPKFILRLGPDEISLEGDTPSEDADVVVESRIAPADLMKTKKRSLALIRALFTGKIKVKGSLRDAFKLYRLSKLLGILLA